MVKPTIGKKQYIAAAYDIISHQGPQALSIRSVARLLNCNTANLYRYFAGLEELLLYASLGYLGDYLLDVQQALKSTSHPVRRHLEVWRCFAEHSFCRAAVFNNLFFGAYSSRLEEILPEYHRLFPEQFAGLDGLERVFIAGNFDYRDYMMLDTCVKEGYIAACDAPYLNQIATNMYKGFLKKVADLNLGGAEALAEVDKFTGLLVFLFGRFTLEGAPLQQKHKYNEEENYEPGTSIAGGDG